MEKKHGVCCGFWFLDNVTNGVPGGWEVAHKIALPSTHWRQFVLSDRGAEGRVALGGTAALSAQQRPDMADGFSCWEC